MRERGAVGDQGQPWLKGCGWPEPSVYKHQKGNEMRILYCDVDTLRPDHTGAYGYQRETSPNLAALASEAVLFERCFTTDSPCVPSRAAFTSQESGIRTGAIGNAGLAAQLPFSGGNGKAPRETYFGAHLYRNGVPTTSFSCFPQRHQAYWFVGNFREWIMPSLSLGDDQMAGDVVDRASEWLAAHAEEESWFLHVHFWDPHIPYVMSPRWASEVAASGPAPEWPDEETIRLHGECYGPHGTQDLYEDNGRWAVPVARSPRSDTMPDAIANRRDFEMLINGYDGAIRYWDAEFGRLLGSLESAGVLSETVVIVTSDHGECFGENACYGDHPFANEAVHRVPLIIKWPGITERLASEARRSRALIYSIDLGPTMCDLLGLPTPVTWEGQSFADAVKGLGYVGRDHLVMSHGAYSSQRAVRTGEYLYIVTLNPGLFRLRPEQLYAIEEDPNMSRDIIDIAPEEVVNALKAKLFDWWQRGLLAQGRRGDPMLEGVYETPDDAFPLGPYLERLGRTGRSHLAEDLKWRRDNWPEVAREPG